MVANKIKSPQTKISTTLSLFFLIISTIFFAQSLCDLNNKVSNSKDALYKGYQRAGRKDLISIIKMSDIENLPHKVWKK